MCVTRTYPILTLSFFGTRGELTLAFFNVRSINLPYLFPRTYPTFFATYPIFFGACQTELPYLFQVYGRESYPILFSMRRTNLPYLFCAHGRELPYPLPGSHPRPAWASHGGDVQVSRS